MLYLVSVTLLSFLALAHVFRGTLTALGEPITHSEAVRRLGNRVVLILPAMLVSFPLVWEMFQTSMAINGGVTFTTWPMIIWLTGMGALAGIAVYGWRLQALHKAKVGGIKLGLTVFALLAYLYLSFVVVDQVRFFTASDDAGLLNLDVMNEIEELPDVKCSEGAIVIRYSNGSDEVTYRCPTTVLLGKFSSHPFVPWPSYTESASTQLGAALRRMHKSATHL